MMLHEDRSLVLIQFTVILKSIRGADQNSGATKNGGKVAQKHEECNSFWISRCFLLVTILKVFLMRDKFRNLRSYHQQFFGRRLQNAALSCLFALEGEDCSNLCFAQKFTSMRQILRAGRDQTHELRCEVWLIQWIWLDVAERWAPVAAEDHLFFIFW